MFCRRAIAVQLLRGVEKAQQVSNTLLLNRTQGENAIRSQIRQRSRFPVKQTEKMKPKAIHQLKPTQKVTAVDFEEPWDEEQAHDFQEKLSFYDHPKYSTGNGPSKSERERIKMAVIRKKYFKDEQESSVLTWEAEEQIRYLYRHSPETWTVQELAENFPVTESGVQKILRSTFQPRTSEILKFNNRTRKRWQALKTALDENIDPDKTMFDHLFTENKIQLLLHAKGRCDLPMPSPRKVVLNHSKVPGMFESVVKDHQLMLSANAEASEKCIDRNSAADTELLAKIIQLAGKVEDLQRKEKQTSLVTLEAGNYRSVERSIVSQTLLDRPKLSRRDRRFQNVNLSEESIDLSNLSSFETYQTEKISHKKYHEEYSITSSKSDKELKYGNKEQSTNSEATNDFSNSHTKTEKRRPSFPPKQSTIKFINSFRFKNF